MVLIVLDGTQIWILLSGIELKIDNFLNFFRRTQ